MAKGTSRLVTDPNDPIFSGGLVMSSPKSKADLTPSTPSSPTNTTGKPIQQEQGFIEDLPSDHPIYTGGYKIGQKTLKDFSENTQATASPPRNLGMDQLPIAEALAAVQGVYSSLVEPLVDLNNLPFDPATRAREHAAKLFKD